MKINWKVRFRNKTWVLAFAMGLIAIIYQMIAVFSSIKKGVPPQELLEETARMLITWLVQIGIVIDPTTKGSSDSKMAMTYTMPRDELGGEHTAEFTDTAHEINDPSDARSENVEG